MESKPLPMGIDSFRELRSKGYYYIDKTLLIADFLKSRAKVTLVTRPRRFGKTLNMAMVKEFFDCDRDSKSVFSNLSIMETEYADQINTRPVLSFSFRDCKGGKQALILSVKRELAREYDRYRAVKPEGAFEEAQYEQIVACLLDGEDDVTPIGDAIAFLSKLVSRHYNKNPLILIDEYDTPMTSAFTEGCYEELRAFFTTLYGTALKGNPHLDQALLTGIQRIAKENIFSGLNNLVVCTVNDEQYNKYFGFSESEAETLLNAYSMELTPEVREMYDGYRFGGREIYNPWSLLSYVNTGKLMPYWVNTSSNALIRRSLADAAQEFLQNFDQLILDGSAVITADLTTSFFEVGRDETLWGLFLNAGYVTVQETLNTMDGLFRIKIPNGEVRQEFKNLVEQHTHLNGGDLKKMFYYLVQQRDIEEFVNIYRKIVLTATSFHDGRENAYHMLMLGMCIYLSSAYEVSSNLESGSGRCDIRLKAKKTGRLHVVMEFKQGDNLKKLAETALAQIKNKQYCADLAGEILLLGIAHKGKSCEVRYEIMTK